MSKNNGRGARLAQKNIEARNRQINQEAQDHYNNFPEGSFITPEEAAAQIKENPSMWQSFQNWYYGQNQDNAAGLGDTGEEMEEEFFDDLNDQDHDRSRRQIRRYRIYPVIGQGSELKLRIDYNSIGIIASVSLYRFDQRDADLQRNEYFLLDPLNLSPIPGELLNIGNNTLTNIDGTFVFSGPGFNDVLLTVNQHNTSIYLQGNNASRTFYTVGGFIDETSSPPITLPPTQTPTGLPSGFPSHNPSSSHPTFSPSNTPSIEPSSSYPTDRPSKNPSSSSPTRDPSSSNPTFSPSNKPSVSPSGLPSHSPSSSNRTFSPSNTPSVSSAGQTNPPSQDRITFPPSVSPAGQTFPPSVQGGLNTQAPSEGLTWDPTPPPSLFPSVDGQFRTNTAFFTENGSPTTTNPGIAAQGGGSSNSTALYAGVGAGILLLATMGAYVYRNITSRRNAVNGFAGNENQVNNPVYADILEPNTFDMVNNPLATESDRLHPVYSDPTLTQWQNNSDYAELTTESVIDNQVLSSNSTGQSSSAGESTYATVGAKSQVNLSTSDNNEEGRELLYEAGLPNYQSGAARPGDLYARPNSNKLTSADGKTDVPRGPAKPTDTDQEFPTLGANPLYGTVNPDQTSDQYADINTADIGPRRLTARLSDDGRYDEPLAHNTVANTPQYAQPLPVNESDYAKADDALLPRPAPRTRAGEVVTLGKPTSLEKGTYSNNPSGR